MDDTLALERRRDCCDVLRLRGVVQVTQDLELRYVGFDLWDISSFTAQAGFDTESGVAVYGVQLERTLDRSVVGGDDGDHIAWLDAVVQEALTRYRQDHVVTTSGIAYRALLDRELAFERTEVQHVARVRRHDTDTPHSGFRIGHLLNVCLNHGQHFHLRGQRNDRVQTFVLDQLQGSLVRINGVFFNRYSTDARSGVLQGQANAQSQRVGAGCFTQFRNQVAGSLFDRQDLTRLVGTQCTVTDVGLNWLAVR